MSTTPLPAVVEQRQRPREPAAHVAERVVPDDPEVPDRARGLGAERGHLLAQPHDVLGERVDVADAVCGERRSPTAATAERGQGDHETEHDQ